MPRPSDEPPAPDGYCRADRLTSQQREWWIAGGDRAAPLSDRRT